MTGTPTQLVGNTQLADTLLDFFTSPAGSVTTISAFILNNTSGRAADVWVHVVPAGVEDGNANQVATRLRVAPHVGPLQVPALVGQVMPAGATLKMRSDVAEAITALISGYVAEAS